MSRFSNLEFDADGTAPKPDAKGEADDLIDETRYLRQAGDQFTQGDWEAALRSYSRALEFDRRLIDAWVGQVFCLAEMDELKEARLWADKALELFRDNPSVLAAKAIVCARMGDSSFGMAITDAAMKGNGLNADVWLARAEVLLLRGEKNADYCFSKALMCEPSNWRLCLRIARTAMRYGVLSLAHEYAQKATEAESGNVWTWLVLGQCQQKMGLAKKAIESMGRVLEREPRHREASRALDALKRRSLWARLFGR